MSKITIEIGMQDLEMIMGGESAAALTIKNTIIQEFTKRHLKALVNNEIMSSIRKNFRKLSNKKFEPKFRPM